MKINTHADIIKLWPSIDDLSSEIGEKYNTVYAWSRRGQIPSMHWHKIIKAGNKRKLKVTLTILFDTSKA